MNLKGEVFFPNLTFEMEKVCEKFWHKNMSSNLRIQDLSCLYFLTLNIWIPKQATAFVFGFYLLIYVGDQIVVFDDANQCNFKT